MNEFWYKLLFYDSIDFMFIINENGDFKEVNNITCTELGFNREEFKNLNITDIAPGFLQEIKSIFFSNKHTKPYLKFETNLHTCPGALIPVEVLVRNISKDNLEPLILITCRNITERKNYEARFEEALLKSQKAEKAKSEFLANMSHEIRTPLNAVLGYADLLKYVNDEEKKKEFLEGIDISAKTLLNLINDILEYSKLEAGKLTLNYKVVNLRDLFNEFLIIFKKYKFEKGIEFSVILDNNLPDYCNIDDTRLKQILLNLIGNAFKFTHEGSIKLVVICHYVSKKDFDLTIEIIDTGIGIQQDKQEEIFFSFNRQNANSKNNYEGTGLGLAITKNICQLFGGTIHVISSPNKGSTFSVFLPNIKEVKEPSNILVGNNILTYDFNQKAVLIVEDIDSNRFVIREFLKNYNLNLLDANNGKEALEIFSKHGSIDLILMDLQMPIMDGYTAIEEIRKLEIGKQVPIIALTAVYKEEDKSETLKKIQAYLQKPIKKNELLQEITKYLTESSPETVSIPKDYLELFRIVFSSKFHLVKAHLLNNEIEDFATELIEFANEHKLHELQKFSHRLYQSATNFKIEKMQSDFLSLNKYFV